MPCGQRFTHRFGQLLTLLRDRGAKFTAAFEGDFESEGVEVIRLPYRAPRSNAFAERWVGSARREVLDRMLIFGRPHLEKVLAEYMDHYNHARPHQGIEQRRPCEPADVIPLPNGRVERRDRLAGSSASTAGRRPDEVTEQGLTTHGHIAARPSRFAQYGRGQHRRSKPDRRRHSLLRVTSSEQWNVAGLDGSGALVTGSHERR